VFIKDFVFKKPDIQILPFPTYFEAEDDDNSEPLVADLGELDPFMVADYLIVAEAGFWLYFKVFFNPKCIKIIFF